MPATDYHKMGLNTIDIRYAFIDTINTQYDYRPASEIRSQSKIKVTKTCYQLRIYLLFKSANVNWIESEKEIQLAIICVLSSSVLRFYVLKVKVEAAQTLYGEPLRNTADSIRQTTYFYYDAYIFRFLINITRT